MTSISKCDSVWAIYLYMLLFIWEYSSTTVPFYPIFWNVEGFYFYILSYMQPQGLIL